MTSPASRPVGAASFAADFLATAPFTLIVATTASAAIYLLGSFSVAADTLLGALRTAGPLGMSAAVALLLVVWALLAWHSHKSGNTRVDRAQAGFYFELCTRLQMLDAALADTCSTGAADQDKDEICNSCRDSIAQARRTLTLAGPQWVLGIGYVSLWQHVHRAEEALIAAGPTSEVVQHALYDLLRLHGSPLEARWTPVLSRSIEVLGHGVPGPPTGASPSSGSTAAGAAHVVTTDSASQPAATGDGTLRVPRDEVEARVAVQRVRRIINEARDDALTSLFRARNHVLTAFVVTGVTTYMLLWLVIGAQVPREVVAPHVALYLGSAVVGLWLVLYRLSGTNDSQEDYGLTAVNLLAVPQSSGSAAVLAAVLAALIPGTLGPTTGSSFELVPYAAGLLVQPAIPSLLPRRQWTMLMQRLARSKEAVVTDPAREGTGDRITARIDLHLGWFDGLVPYLFGADIKSSVRPQVTALLEREARVFESRAAVYAVAPLLWLLAVLLATVVTAYLSVANTRYIAVGLFVASAGISFLLLATALSLYVRWRYPIDPYAEICYWLLRILHTLTSQPMDWTNVNTKRAVTAWVEEVAQHIEGDLPRSVRTGDYETQAWLRESAMQMARAVRRLKRSVLTPKETSREWFLERIARALLCVARGDWDALQPEWEPLPLRERWRSWASMAAIRIWAAVLSVAIPQLFLLRVQQEQLLGAGTPMRLDLWLPLGVLLLQAIGVMVALNPYFRDTLAALQGLKDLKQVLPTSGAEKK